MANVEATAPFIDHDTLSQFPNAYDNPTGASSGYVQPPGYPTIDQHLHSPPPAYDNIARSGDTPSYGTIPSNPPAYGEHVPQPVAYPPPQYSSPQYPHYGQPVGYQQQYTSQQAPPVIAVQPSIQVVQPPPVQVNVHQNSYQYRTLPQEVEQYVPDHMCLSIFSIFCCFCLGIFSIINASNARTLKAQGQYNLALVRAKTAKSLAVTAISIGCFLIIINIILQILVFSGSDDGGDDSY